MITIEDNSQTKSKTMSRYTITDSFRFSKKKFFRAPQWELKLVVRILIGFLVLYFLAAFLLLGIGIYFIAEDFLPDQNPVYFINDFLVYYLGLDLLIRYFIQTLPVTEIKPLIIQPISKTKITWTVILRSMLSFFNWIPLIILLPFCIVFTLNEPTNLNLWPWLLSVLLVSGINNFLIFFINKRRSAAIAGGALFVGGYFVEKTLEIPVLSFFEKGFDKIFEQPLWALAVAFLFYFVMIMLFRFLKGELYLDKGLSKKSERMVGTELKAFDRIGPLGVFIKNDIRLIIRNIRARQVVFMGFLFLFYGLIFFTQEVYLESPTMLIFAGVFTTGGFMLTFGQLVPAWDSEYYSFLMCQNIPYRKYLKSKLYLMMFSVLISLVLSLPYLYFGWKVMSILLVSAIFNFGFGSFVTLFSGAYNSTPVKLNVKAKAFENTQNFSLSQFLFTLPKIVLPVLVFYIPYHFFGFNAGLISVGFTGLMGLLFSRLLLSKIEKIYQKRKHQTLSSFKKT